MRKFLLLILSLIQSGEVAFAFDSSQLVPPLEHATLQPQLPDLYPHDGIVDGGSVGNPLILQTPNGARYEVRPQLPDIFPNDGMLDAGSSTNPWVIAPAK